MARIITKKGDVFVAHLGDGTKKYFQYACNDLSQLNSDVIRVFAKSYAMEENPALEEVVKGEVMFYAHCVLKFGIKLSFWEKVGKAPNDETVDVFFRGSNDSGCKVGEQVKVSYRWYVWKVNEPFIRVGKLEGENQKAELGLVINPLDVVNRMKTGKYNFFYPDFKERKEDDNTLITTVSHSTAVSSSLRLKS